MPLRPLSFLVLLAISIARAQAPSAVQQPDPSSPAIHAEHGAPSDPVLHNRPPQPAGSAASPKRMQLDVVVTDAAGKPVTGLQPWDFKLLDDDRPRKIVFFRAFGPAASKPDPPVEIILLLDLLNLSPQQAAFARNELNRFLTQNGGHLAQPVTLAVLTDKGLAVQAQASRDGNTMAAQLKTVRPSISTINAAMGLDGALDRFGRSLRNIRFIAENESHRPGRKLLVWIGTGWPMLETQNFVPGPEDRSNYFQSIVQLSNWFREARMAVYSVSTGLSDRAVFYKSFLKPVVDARQADSGNLALRVLALQTGGQVLGPSNDLAGQIRQCIADSDSFYQLTFDAPPAERPDEYHSLTVSARQPGLTVRTDTGYYDEPPRR